MKKEFAPFYVSRAVLSAAFAILVMGFHWTAMLFTLILFAGFLLYLHSGWFRVDLSHPLLPLRRDVRGYEIQRKALITSVVAGILIYFASPYLTGLIGFSFSGNVVFSVGIITYFLAQFVFFTRA